MKDLKLARIIDVDLSKLEPSVADPVKEVLYTTSIVSREVSNEDIIRVIRDRENEGELKVVSMVLDASVGTMDFEYCKDRKRGTCRCPKM